MDQKMTKADFMKMRPGVTEDILKEAKEEMVDHGFKIFNRHYILICADNSLYYTVFRLNHNSKENRIRIVNDVIDCLRNIGTIKEIDVQEEAVKIWIDGSEYAFIPCDQIVYEYN